MLIKMQPHHIFSKSPSLKNIESHDNPQYFKANYPLVSIFIYHTFISCRKYSLKAQCMILAQK